MYPTNNVEGIADTSTDKNGYLCHRKGEEEAHRAGVILPRAQSHDDVESGELEATVRNDSSERNAKTQRGKKKRLSGPEAVFFRQPGNPSKIFFPGPTSETRRLRA